MTREMVARGTELVLAECEPHLVNVWARLGQAIHYRNGLRRAIQR